MKESKTMQISLGVDPMTGKRIRKRITYTSKTDLERKKKDLITEYAKHGAPSNITFGEYKKRWVAANCAGLAVSTQSAYDSALKKTTRFDNIKMKDIIRTDLQKLVTEYKDTPYTARRLAIILNSIWESAVTDRVVERNIAHKLKRAPIVKKEKRILTEEEKIAIKSADLTEMERFFVNIIRQFGLRPAEASALSPKDFNRKDLTLSITKAVTYVNGQAVLKPTKTYKNRTLPVPESFFSLIPSKKCVYFFTNDKGNILTKQQLREMGESIFSKVNKQMGGTDKLKVTDMTFYTFRHTKATELYYLSGISMKKKAEYMGHSEEMFLQTYSHLDKTKEDVEILRQAVM